MARQTNLPRGLQVYEWLRLKIQKGNFQPGDRIREDEVARVLQVSRTPVREATSRLQDRGLLEATPYGLIVSSLGRPQVLELYAIREILEGSAARFAAKHASDSEIAALRDIAMSFEENFDSPDEMARLNRKLHEAISEAGHNRYLSRSLDELHDVLALLAGTTFQADGRPAEAAEEHRRIIEAIARHDADGAEREAREHIQKAQSTRLRLMMEVGRSDRTSG